jgi:rRNA maturation protein Rpf1
MNLDGVAEKAIEVKADKVVVVDRWQGGPGRISLYRLGSSGLDFVPPLMLIKGIRLRREFKIVKKHGQSSVITFAPENSSVLENIAGQLSQFFGLPVHSLNDAAEKHVTSMHLSFDRSGCLQLTFKRLQRMVEIGPRVTFSKLIWDVSS